MRRRIKRVWEIKVKIWGIRVILIVSWWGGWCMMGRIMKIPICSQILMQMMDSYFKIITRHIQFLLLHLKKKKNCVMLDKNLFRQIAQMSVIEIKIQLGYLVLTIRYLDIKNNSCWTHQEAQGRYIRYM